MSRVGNGEVTIGSAAHRDLFCRSFLDTHLPYDPHALPWPELDAPSLDRLCALPFWDEAVHTERATAAKVQAQADREPDPLVREARHILFFANWAPTAGPGACRSPARSTGSAVPGPSPSPWATGCARRAGPAGEGSP